MCFNGLKQVKDTWDTLDTEVHEMGTPIGEPGHLIYDVLVHVQIVVLLVNKVEIVVILVVIVVVEVVGNVGDSGEDGDGHGEEGHLGEGDCAGVRGGGARVTPPCWNVTVVKIPFLSFFLLSFCRLNGFMAHGIVW